MQKATNNLPLSGAGMLKCLNGGEGFRILFCFLQAKGRVSSPKKQGQTLAPTPI